MPLPSEWRHRATSLQWSTNVHGDEACQATLDITTDEALSIIVNNRVDPVVITGPDGQTLYQGRLDDPSLTLGEEGAFSFAALGPWAALGDLEESYTALWSTTSLDWWRPVTRAEVGTCDPAKFTFDQQNRLFVGLQKNTSYGNAPWTIETLAFFPPSGGGRQPNGMSFDYAINLPVGWTFRWMTWTAGFGALTLLSTIAATGALQTGSVVWGFTANDIVVFDIYRNAANAVYAGETGDSYVSLTNVRVVSSLANIVSTTLTVARTNGAAVNVTVASTAGMYVGQRVGVSGGGNSESMIVLSVPSSTVFTATVVNAPVGGYPIGTLLSALVIYGDEVASDIAAFVNSVNSDQLAASASTSTMSLDLVDCVYEDATPSEVINDLCAKSGDGSIWEAGVESGALYMRPRGQRARAWMVDVESVTLTMSLAELVNSAYAVYKDAAGATLRSAVNADTTSIATYGVTRRRPVSANTTSAVQAEAERDALLEDKAAPGARTTIPNITALYDANGNRWPLWEANAGRGDTITLRNVAPEVASSLDARLTFRLSRTTYNPFDETLTVELEAPTPGIAL
jgi:hypothetical protein